MAGPACGEDHQRIAGSVVEDSVAAAEDRMIFIHRKIGEVDASLKSVFQEVDDAIGQSKNPSLAGRADQKQRLVLIAERALKAAVIGIIGGHVKAGQARAIGKCGGVHRFDRAADLDGGQIIASAEDLFADKGEPLR